jgi:hypothetical protein
MGRGGRRPAGNTIMGDDSRSITWIFAAAGERLQGGGPSSDLKALVTAASSPSLGPVRPAMTPGALTTPARTTRQVSLALPAATGRTDDDDGVRGGWEWGEWGKGGGVCCTLVL